VRAQVSQVLKLAVVAVLSAASSAGGVAALAARAHGPTELRAARAEAPPSPRPRAAAPGAASAAILKAGDGHYWADGVANGRTVRFLVDTGATEVALTPQDARRLGYDPAHLRYGDKVVTAAGQIRAASIRLASLTVAGVRLENVDALVIEKGLDTSLLGMTYLGRLSRFEATPAGLVLQL
jgi:aspartyl protease family protein